MQPLINANDLQLQAKILIGFVALIWSIEIIDQLIFQGRLDRLGIRPRTQTGLRGIVFAPLLHGTWKHITTDTLPLIVLGWLVLVRGLEEFAIVTVATWIVSGLGVWLFAARNSIHIGVSGVIFGYLGFLLFRSYFDRDLLSAGLALVVVFLYGPLIWGVLPLRRGISWQGHLFGFIGGILTARYLPELKLWLETL